MHTLEAHFRDVRMMATEHGLESALVHGSPDGLVLPYDELVNVMEHLKVVAWKYLSGTRRNTLKEPAHNSLKCSLEMSLNTSSSLL